MGSLSNYLENKLLDHILGNTVYTQLDALYVGLSTADPLDDDSGLSEPSGNSYARVVIGDWDTGADRTTQNSTIISFPEATGLWGTITHWAIFDALTSGNVLAHGSLTPIRVVANGGTFYFEAGSIDITISSGGISDAYANALLDHIFLNDALTPPANIYMAWSDTTITDSDTGSTISEPSGGSYARVNHNAYDAAASGASENTGTITSPTATASWGTLTDWAIIDASTVGDIIFYSALDSSIAVGIGDEAHWADGALDITLD